LAKRNQIEQINFESNCNILLRKQEEIMKAIDRKEMIELFEPDIEMNSTLAQSNLEVIHDEISEIQEDNHDAPRLTVDNNALRTRMKTLNKEQNEILNKIRLKLISTNSEPCYEIIHGLGGVGKSFLAKIIIDLIDLSLDIDAKNLKKNVIVAAPTGVAAKAIAGRTLHNAFSLPIEKFGLGNYVGLKGLDYLFLINNGILVKNFLFFIKVWHWNQKDSYSKT